MRNILIFLIIFSQTISQAQDSIPSDKSQIAGAKWGNGLIGLIIGGYGDNSYHSKYSDSPESRFLKSDQQLLSFNKNDFNINNSNSFGGGTFVNPYISFHPWNKKRKLFNKRQELRIGVILYSNSGRKIAYDNKYDSRINGDTTLVSNVTFENKRDDLGLNVGYTGTSDEFWYRFSLYAGVDLGVSYSITHSVLQKVTTSTYSLNNGYYINSYDVSYKDDQFKELKGRASLGLRGNVLVGLNLRLIDPIIVFTEGRIGYAYIQPFGRDAALLANYNLNVGFKFSF